MLEYARSSGKSLTYVGIGMFAFSVALKTTTPAMGFPSDYSTGYEVGLHTLLPPSPP